MTDVNSLFGTEESTWICPRCKAENSKQENFCARCNTAHVIGADGTPSRPSATLQSQSIASTLMRRQNQQSSNPTSNKPERMLSKLGVAVMVFFLLLALIGFIFALALLLKGGETFPYGLMVFAYVPFFVICALSAWAFYKVTANISLTLKEMNAKMK